MIIAYCFIGPLPVYAVDTVHQMRLFYDGPIYFIISDEDSPYCTQLKRMYVTLVPYHSVIDHNFNQCVTDNNDRFEIIHNLHGREKLFIYSFERFAVLNQMMIKYQLSDVFFLELDNLIYDNPFVWSASFALKDMAYMYDKEDRCCSGVCFIKNTGILTEFVEYCITFITTTTKFITEMTALYEFWQLHTDRIQILPTHWPSEVSSIVHERYHLYQSVFDSAPMGVYLGGIDPYHSNGVLTKGLKWYGTDIDYTQYQYKWVKDVNERNIPYVLYNDTWIRINNLHIHSTDLTSNLSRPYIKPIISVNIMGGLGNQLFQIAAAYSYAKQHNAALQILHTTSNGKRPLYWDTILSIMKPYLVESLPTVEQWYEDLPTMYKVLPDSPHGLYLNGYLQSSKYHIPEIKQLFRQNLSDALSVPYRILLANKRNVVVMHARQTDYVTNSDIHGPLTHNYYERALRKMTEYVPHPFLVLCGDDTTFWDRMQLDYPHIILEENDINTFALLQQFQHFIMSNSTFIWWCTYLADAKHVIAPAKWFGPAGPHPYEDIYESSWIRM